MEYHVIALKAHVTRIRLWVIRTISKTSRESKTLRIISLGSRRISDVKHRDGSSEHRGPLSCVRLSDLLGTACSASPSVVDGRELLRKVLADPRGSRRRARPIGSAADALGKIVAGAVLPTCVASPGGRARRRQRPTLVASATRQPRLYLEGPLAAWSAIIGNASLGSWSPLSMADLDSHEVAVVLDRPRPCCQGFRLRTRFREALYHASSVAPVWRTRPYSKVT